MSQEVAVRSQAIDWDDKLATVSVAASATETLLVFQDSQTQFFARTGRKCRITFVGNSVDPGGEASVTFHILINGTRMTPPYNSFQQALGVTYDGWSTLSVPIEIPQGAMIQVSADNSDGSTAYNAFIRIRVEYEPLN